MKPTKHDSLSELLEKNPNAVTAGAEMSISDSFSFQPRKYDKYRKFVILHPYAQGY